MRKVKVGSFITLLGKQGDYMTIKAERKTTEVNMTIIRCPRCFHNICLMRSYMINEKCHVCDSSLPDIFKKHERFKYYTNREI